MAALPDFATLERLKTYLAALRENHVYTMRHYRSDDGLGFYHEAGDRTDASLSSSATCIASLVHAGKWKEGKDYPWWDATNEIADRLLKKKKKGNRTGWTSADLELDNPFSVSFIVEGILDLQKAHPGYKNSEKHTRIVQNKATPILKDAIARGYVKIAKYPPSAYLTQLVFRVLERLGKVDASLRRRVHAWSVSEVAKQIALISADSQIGDPLSLAYALIVAKITVSEEKTRPEEKEMFTHALTVFFKAQKSDGSWPLSQPLFHYPKVGSAHCYEYELLTQLLSCQQLRNDLLPYIPKLATTAYRLEKTSFDLDDRFPHRVIAWASGHHPQLPGPESWSTASVYDFVHALDRVVAEAVRRVVLQELRIPYAAPVPPKTREKEFASDLLDANLSENNGRVRSLRKTLGSQFVFPIAKAAPQVAAGGSLGDVPMSAILFGPPGVSKTRLASYIGEYIGWPLLTVDPSFLVQKGLDRIQAQANHLFNLLAITEQVVVLLDEFDEMGRNRSRSQELLSRFITTAMLPKLVIINDQRKIVFLLATNFISGFDAAFSRGGRFDMLIQVMPPSGKAKLRKWAVLKAAFDKLSEEQRHTVYPWIEDLTYTECDSVRKKLTAKTTPDETYKLLEEAWRAGTLNQQNEVGGADKVTWKTTCETERDRIRLRP